MSDNCSYREKAPPKKKRDTSIIINIDTNIFDIEEIYPNCTVQILRNSITGVIRIGWWRNEE